MNVIVAKTAGFCFGVKRAVDFAYSKLVESKFSTESSQDLYVPFKQPQICSKLARM